GFTFIRAAPRLHCPSVLLTYLLRELLRPSYLLESFSFAESGIISTFYFPGIPKRSRRNAIKIIVTAGGQGTKLWPYSRTNKPKQFQSIVGDKSAYQEAV